MFRASKVKGVGFRVLSIVSLGCFLVLLEHNRKEFLSMFIRGL